MQQQACSLAALFEDGVDHYHRIRPNTKTPPFPSPNSIRLPMKENIPLIAVNKNVIPFRLYYIFQSLRPVSSAASSNPFVRSLWPITDSGHASLSAPPDLRDINRY